VLDLAAAQPDTRSFIEATTGGHDYKTFDCNRTRTLFRAVGQFKKERNNRSAQTSDLAVHQSASGMGTKLDPAMVNKKNEEFYKQQQY